MQKYFTPDLGLFLIRFGLAAIFVAHGLGKLINLGPTAAFFLSLGLPAFMAYVIGILELVCGLAMLAGIFVRAAGILIVGIMIGAIALVRISVGFMGGWEFEMLILLVALGIVFIGPGKYVVIRGS